MNHSSSNSESEGSHCIYWDDKGQRTGPCDLLRYGGGIDAATVSFSLSGLEVYSSDDSSCGSKDSECEGDSVRTPPRSRSEQRRKRKKSPVNLLCGKDETPATIGKFQRRRLPSPPAGAAAQDIAALNDEFGNDEDDWDLNAIDRSVAKAQHQKRAWHCSRLLYQEPQEPQLAAPNYEFGNEEDGWDLNAIDRSVAIAQHQKRARHCSRHLYQEPQHQLVAPNDEFGNEEDGWDLNAIDHSVAIAQHQKRARHCSRHLYQEPQHQRDPSHLITAQYDCAQKCMEQDDDPASKPSPQCLIDFPHHYNNDELFAQDDLDGLCAGRGHLCNSQAVCQEPFNLTLHNSTDNASSEFSDYGDDLFSFMGPMDFAAIDKCVDERYQRLPSTRTAALKSDGKKITSASVEKPYLLKKLHSSSACVLMLIAWEINRWTYK